MPDDVPNPWDDLLRESYREFDLHIQIGVMIDEWRAERESYWDQVADPAFREWFRLSEQWAQWIQHGAQNLAPDEPLPDGCLGLAERISEWQIADAEHKKCAFDEFRRWFERMRASGLNATPGWGLLYRPLCLVH